jgi:mannose-1-phosphate guanylyltransferase / mannose-6-phosphate isomerase
MTVVQQFQVQLFVEKPDAETAMKYIEDGSYCWNSGMFLWKASTILDAIDKHVPEIAKVLSKFTRMCDQGDDIQHVINAMFHQMPDVSIDVGVLEKVGEDADNLLEFPCEIAWSDIGSWDAVYDVQEKDDNKNVFRGNVVALDCENSLLHSNHRLITAVGVDDVCLVETADAIMLTKRGETQRVKEVVNELKRRRSQEHILHLTVQRPWGSYTVLEDEPGFKMKRILLILAQNFHFSDTSIVPNTGL